MTKEEIKVVVDEFASLGGAFVEDDFLETQDGEVYNPLVDRENATMWLKDKLMAL